MTRPAIPGAIRLVLVALGVCCLIISLLALWEFCGCKTAQGVVEVYPVVEYERTNMHTQVAYTRADDTRTVVMSSDIPLSVRAGEHLTVVYDPQRMKGSWLLSSVWSIPVYATVLGIVLTSLGSFARGRRREVFGESHANAA